VTQLWSSMSVEDTFVLENYNWENKWIELLFAFDTILASEQGSYMSVTKKESHALENFGF
jgi:hypothetical protein